MVVEQPGGANRRMLAIIAAVVVAAASIGGLLYYVSQQSGGGGGNTVSVVIAATPLTAGTKVTADQVTVASRPAGQVPADAITSTDQVVGQYVNVNATAQTVVTQGMISSVAVSSAPRLDIPNGYVAMAIPNDPAGLNTYIQPEDHIDILVVSNQTGIVRYSFQDVRVLRAAGTSVSSTNGAAASSTAATTTETTTGSGIIVTLPRDQAEDLAWLLTPPLGSTAAAASTGVIPTNSQIYVLRYVLRNVDQSWDPTGQSKTRPKTPNYLDESNQPCPAFQNPNPAITVPDCATNTGLNPSIDAAHWQTLFPNS
jgi:Flp pilus assembly protein CpaB